MSAVEVVPLAPGAFHLRGYLSPPEQRRVAAMVQALADGPAGFYRPRVRGGGFMHCDMLCLGRHWNARTYTYERQRLDHDGRPAPPLPPELARPAVEAAARVGFALDPDICLVNRYGEGGRMGLHQDKDEDASTLDAGVPVVSLSARGDRPVPPRRVPAPRIDHDDRSAIRRRVRDGRTESVALSRSGAYPARVRAAGFRSARQDQSDVSPVRARGARALTTCRRVGSCCPAHTGVLDAPRDSRCSTGFRHRRGGPFGTVPARSGVRFRPSATIL